MGQVDVHQITKFQCDQCYHFFKFYTADGVAANERVGGIKLSTSKS